ncbi:hypothetical protein ACFVQB_14170 [Paenibacillus sp. NPDC057886]|uniref:hypothetical protein n=1 Tax=Paenibacillus sp. NPDC057886 TaxID=3346270 RepID=UPI00368B32D2
MGKPFVNLEGKKLGELTILKRVYPKTKQTCAHWLCKCNCGKKFISQSGALIGGHTKRCVKCRQGLRRKCDNKRILNTWNHMIQRCYTMKATHYNDYGGRGIKVCDEWRNSPQEFEKWAMSNGYSDVLTIDRINVDGNYEPDNCRWVDQKTQANNKRNNRYVEYEGIRKTIKQWSEELGVSEYRIRYRMNQGITDPKIILSKNKLYRLKPYLDNTES